MFNSMRSNRRFDRLEVGGRQMNATELLFTIALAVIIIGNVAMTIFFLVRGGGGDNVDLSDRSLHCYNNKCNNEYTMTLKEFGQATLELGSSAFDRGIPNSGLTCPKCKVKGMAFPMLVCPKCNAHFAQDINAVQPTGKEAAPAKCPKCGTDYAEYLRAHPMTY